MADKIIVVERKRHGCGCFFMLALAALVVWVVYSCHSDMQKTAAEIRAHEASLTPEQRAAEAIAKPNDLALNLQIRSSLRRFLKDPDSYKPGETRFHSHPNGYAYFHDYRAKNSFGGYTREVCGFLCATNTGRRVWTFYSQADLPVLLKECGID